MIFGNWRPGGTAVGAGLFGFTDSLQSQSDETSHALLLVVAVLFAVLAIRSLVLKRRRSAIVARHRGRRVPAVWYQTTDDVPTEFIPLPAPRHHAAGARVRHPAAADRPAADGRVFRRGGGE